jgi:hypothetical protein
MSVNTRLLESIDIVVGTPPADLDSAATVDWVSLKNYDGCLVVLAMGAGTAGSDPSIILLQATAVAGTSSKALNCIRRLYYKVGTQTSVSTFSSLAITTATGDIDTVSVNGSVDLAADAAECLFVVDVRTSDLDVDNGFDCLGFTWDDADIGAAKYGTILYIPYGARYPQATPKTAITD